MKRLLAAAFLLVFLFGATLWNVSYLVNFTSQVAGILTEAESKAEGGDWTGAETMTGEAKALWESREPYLYTTLFHSDTDEIYVGFREVLELIYQQENGEYSAANAHLIAKLELLGTMDQFSIQNIL